ncbi:MAG TPA: MiaB/RimO family radical SAM methylthiotransferase, partial [Candidatus Goldiibacteriota bacterium]|nr:MiaB/RimO family radical SAM methylthiotransferase [Candidatus Goldiibacteriota bacterium]
MKIGVISLGCPKNTVDTECMLSMLPAHTLTGDPKQADAIIINTCAFLKAARDESAQAVRDMSRAAKKGARIIIAGCFVSKDFKALKKMFPEAHAFVGINNIPDIGRALSEGGVFTSGKPFVYEGRQHRAVLNPYSVYVKISEGCNHACSFCAIPGIKGKYRSRQIDDISLEVKKLVDSGAREINLISQDLSYYGVDNYGSPALAKLLSAILGATKKKFWLRLLYLYPDLRVIRQVVEVMKKDSRVCRYIDMPLQHINDRILKSMRRGYNREQAMETLREIRKVPGVCIRSSFIAGYPSETEKEFTELLDFVSAGYVDKPGVFGYSDEPGTASCALKGKLSRKAVESRVRRLTLASAGVCRYNDEKLAGLVKEALVVTRLSDRKYAARTEE